MKCFKNVHQGFCWQAQKKIQGSSLRARETGFHSKPRGRKHRFCGGLSSYDSHPRPTAPIWSLLLLLNYIITPCMFTGPSQHFPIYTRSDKNNSISTLQRTSVCQCHFIMSIISNSNSRSIHGFVCHYKTKEQALTAWLKCDWLWGRHDDVCWICND